MKNGTGCWTRTLVDATRSWEFERNPAWGNRRFPPLNKLPVALEEKVRARWAEYGIGGDYLSEEKRELLTFAKLSKRFPEV